MSWWLSLLFPKFTASFKKYLGLVASWNQAEIMFGPSEKTSDTFLLWYTLALVFISRPPDSKCQTLDVFSRVQLISVYKHMRII